MATYQSISTTIRPVVTTGNFTLTAPAGGTSGDLYVACIVYRGTHGSGGPPSLPTGWTIIQRHNNTTAVSNTSTTATAVGAAMMAWIVRGATEPNLVFGATVNQQFTNAAIGSIIRISGADTTNPVDASSVNTLAAGGTAATTTAINTSSENDLLILGCFGGQEGANLTAQWSAQQVGGVNMTERNDQGTTSGADCSISVATLNQVNTGTTGAGTATCTASARHTLILAAIRPAQVAGNNARSFSVLI
jgi:hypothetical protein